ncbi:MAG: hypothetical protein IJE63_04275 [Clostridia bacterium]|nr:hypothetical protein [Clostridia bacterium]MBQ7101244.1 hypothetical protein [Clostridia bacterium]
MDIMKILLVALAACICVVLVSQHRPEFSLLLQLCAVGAIALLTADALSEVFVRTKELVADTKINSEYINLLLKALAIALCGRVVCDICSDTGNRAVATCADMACRLSIMLLSLPMLKALVQLAMELIEG